MLEGVLITDARKKIKKIFNSSPEEGHIHIIVKPPTHIPNLDSVETVLSLNKNVDLKNGCFISSKDVIPWISSESDKSLLQAEDLCRALVIPFCRSNDIKDNRKEMDRLTLSAFGRTASEAFSRNICVVCGVQPERFHNDASRQEYEKISRICPACWETETLPPDESMEEIKRSQQILLSYDRELVLCQQLPHAWKCLCCKKVIQGKERLTHAVKCRGM